VTQKQKPSAEGGRAGKSVESDQVAVVTPSDVEVPPPPPIEKEQATSSVSDLDEVGETEEISLNLCYGICTQWACIHIHEFCVQENVAGCGENQR